MKGCDLAFVQVEPEQPGANNTGNTPNHSPGAVVMDYDEFRQIRLARYQTPNEALLSIWGNKLAAKSHQVESDSISYFYNFLP